MKGAPGWRTGHFEVNTGHAILSASEANSSGRLEVLAVHLPVVNSGSDGVRGRTPVRHYQAVEAPFVAENVIDKGRLVVDILPVDLVVGSHDAPRVRCFDDDLKRAKIDLSDKDLALTRNLAEKG